MYARSAETLMLTLPQYLHPWEWMFICPCHTYSFSMYIAAFQILSFVQHLMVHHTFCFSTCSWNADTYQIRTTLHYTSSNWVDIDSARVANVNIPAYCWRTVRMSISLPRILPLPLHRLPNIIQREGSIGKITELTRHLVVLKAMMCLRKEQSINDIVWVILSVHCNPIWEPTYQCNSIKLETLKHRIIRIIFNAKRSCVCARSFLKQNLESHICDT